MTCSGDPELNSPERFKAAESRNSPRMKTKTAAAIPHHGMDFPARAKYIHPPRMTSVASATIGETNNMPMIPMASQINLASKMILFFAGLVSPILPPAATSADSYQWINPYRAKALNAIKYGSRMAEPPTRMLSGYNA